MGKLTICPHFLVDYPLNNPQDIENTIIQPLVELLSLAEDNNVSIYLSTEIMALFQDRYPWHKMDDDLWTGYLRNWHLLITQKLARNSQFLAGSSPYSTDHCNAISADINSMFQTFLSAFAISNMPNGLKKEAIITNDKCGDTPTPYQGLFRLDKPVKFMFVLAPWLRLYKKPLPYRGQFPFVPPQGWENMAILPKGPQHGFVDNGGNEWVWDLLHKNHWDVQHPAPNRGYSNICPEGKRL
ncbi:polymorphic toxin type 17 domain-containing protein [Vibrio splendidus]